MDYPCWLHHVCQPPGTESFEQSTPGVESRGYGGGQEAVRRNRIKRLVREWYRHTQAHTLVGCDLVVIARRGLPESPVLGDLAADLDRSFRGLGTP